MWDNVEIDRHYTGVFKILNEEISGELIYNKQKGIILLNLTKQLDQKTVFGKSYGSIEIITGKLNSGATVTLFNNRCTNNHTLAFGSQQLNFVSKYLIWSNRECSNSQQYNKMVCTLRNAYEWSGFSAFEESDLGIKMKSEFESKSFRWFDAKITFSTFLNNSLYTPPQEEETKIIQLLLIEIETNNKQSVIDFISIRNKILALISFAIKNNVNIEEQYLCDYDDSYVIAGDITDYRKHYLWTDEPMLDIIKTRRWEYNFTLNDLSEDKDYNNELSKLEPVLNLYLSLFKYEDMPVEMVFLNIIQALETFHSRFFYDNKKDKYIQSVVDRFGDSEMYKNLLLSPTQMDKNCGFIILVSRLNDLLIGKGDGLFCEYYLDGGKYAQTIADTRHYYTHYGKSKESKALKDEELLEAIYVLRMLLEYHICLILDLEKRDAIAQQLRIHWDWKYLQEQQAKKHS